jgi:hypothetical protein
MRSVGFEVARFWLTGLACFAGCLSLGAGIVWVIFEIIVHLAR